LRTRRKKKRSGSGNVQDLGAFLPDVVGYVDGDRQYGYSKLGRQVVRATLERQRLASAPSALRQSHQRGGRRGRGVPVTPTRRGEKGKGLYAMRVDKSFEVRQATLWLVLISCAHSFLSLFPSPAPPTPCLREENEAPAVLYASFAGGVHALDRGAALALYANVSREIHEPANPLRRQCDGEEEGQHGTRGLGQAKG
jgi:hypothetical protein